MWNTIGDIAQDVEAGCRHEIPAMGEIQIDVGAKIVDGAVLIAGDGTQRIPSGVFEKDIVVTVNTVLVVDEAPGFGRIRICRRRDRLEYYLLDFHSASLNIFEI